MSHVVEILDQVRGFLETGGNVLWVIFGVTALMWTLIIERLVYFRWIHPAEARRVTERWRERSDRSSWFADKIRTLERSEASQNLNRSLPTIKTLVALCPLLGLLGTVTGMIEVFDVMAMVGSGNARAMAAGVSMATIPTMAGMVAALSGMYFATRLGRRAQEKTRQLEDTLTAD
jgi:biopolymer transport protein ExbB